MALSDDLISQFAKIVSNDKKTKSETTVYGTVVEHNGSKYVKLDGSDLLTPVESTTNFENEERVTVMIKDHTATVTGNISSPAVRTEEVKDIGSQITELEIVIAGKVETVEFIAQVARIDTLQAENVTIKETLTANEADIKKLEADSVTVNDTLIAHKADIDELVAQDATFTGKLEAVDADIDSLQAENVVIKNNLDAQKASIDELEAGSVTITEELTAVKADIEILETDKLNATDADIKFANIDFSNIGEAAIKKLFTDSGIIKDLAVENGAIAGELVGVTIKGDIIEGGTIVADKLVVKGEDGLYYKLNFEAGNFTEGEEVPTDSLHGSVITAKSITAEKVTVSDLVAFGATIGGFNITDDSIYSGVKSSVDNSTRGIYLDNDGQISIGDSDSFLRYYKTTDDDGNETYKLEISAESILFGSNRKTSAADIEALTEHVKIGTYIDPETNNEQPSISLAEGDSDFKQVITNTKTMFMDGTNVSTTISNTGIETDNVVIKKTKRHGHWVEEERANGNLGLRWVDD